MHKIIFFTIFILLGTEVFAQIPCSDEDILAVKGSWKKRADQNMRADKNQAEINNRLDQISKIFQSAYPNPKGIEANWYATMDATPLVNNGPVPYNFNSLYLAWYCNLHLQKMMPGTETGTWAYVAVNSLNWFINNQYDNPHLTIDGKPVYQLPLKKGDWKGYSTYESNAYRDKSRCIIITRKNELPWNPISQQHYLQTIKTQWQEQKQSSADNYSKQEENIKHSISVNNQSKILKDAQKAELNASLQKQLNDFLKTKDQTIARSNKNMDDKIKIIDQYMNEASPAVLQGPAIIDRGSGGGFKGSFSTEEKGGCLLVSINENYFDMKLPHYVPQLIVLFWRWDNKATGLDFKKQMEENFDVEKLKAMIDK
jgi:hypothetical protein